MPLIILEGADGAGKTTLMRSLVSHYGYIEVMARESTLDQTDEEMCHKLSYAINRAAKGEYVVLDRCWISEAIYSRQVRKREPRIHPFQARMLERLALSAEVKIIICDPGEAVARSNFMGRNEYIKDVNQWCAVHTEYLSPQKYTSIPTVRYDYLRETSLKDLCDPDTFVGGLQVENIYGNPDANTLVIVNDKYEGATVPCINWGWDSVSARITRNFERAGVSEFELAWLNMPATDTLEMTIEDMLPDYIVCIGDNVAETVERETQFKVDAVLSVPSAYDGDYSKILERMYAQNV